MDAIGRRPCHQFLNSETCEQPIFGMGQAESVNLSLWPHTVSILTDLFVFHMYSLTLPVVVFYGARK